MSGRTVHGPYTHSLQSIPFLFLVMAESNLPTTGEEVDLDNERQATGERKQQKKLPNEYLKRF